MMTMLMLVRRGYGSLTEIQAMDTTEFLDLVEFEQMTCAIERYEREHGGK